LEGNIMKKLILAAALLPMVALAQNAPSPDDNMARVINVQPIQGQGTQRQVCDQAPAQTQSGDGHSILGSVIGGLGGALVGSRFGEGHGQTALTVAGAVGGAMVGDRVGANMASNNSTPQPSCRTVNDPGPTRYQVTYEWHGVQNTSMMDRQPGDYVRIRKSISLDE
jgi:uncharacterized protein YcfJ